MNTYQRKPVQNCGRQLALAGCVFLLMAPPAHAYIDPGTGTMILQVIGAAVAGTLFYFNNFKRRVSEWLSKRKPSDGASGQSAKRP